MDNAQIPHTYRTERQQAVMAMMEAMDGHQLDQAYAILHAIAQPRPKAANGE